jgi:hypothetical protein
MAPAGGGGCGILVARRNTRRRKCAMRSASRCRASFLGWQFVADWSKHGFDLLRGDSALPRVLARRRPALIDVIDSAAAIFDNLVNVSIGCPVHATCAGGGSRADAPGEDSAIVQGKPHWLAILGRDTGWRHCPERTGLNIVLNIPLALSFTQRRKSLPEKDLRQRLMPPATRATPFCVQ